MVDQITAMYEISIHALRKESDPFRQFLVREFKISIHALRKESDRLFRIHRLEFLISIHALRKESDARGGIATVIIINFNPRSP